RTNPRSSMDTVPTAGRIQRRGVQWHVLMSLCGGSARADGVHAGRAARAAGGAADDPGRGSSCGGPDRRPRSRHPLRRDLPDPDTGTRDASLPNLARSVNNLAVRLVEVGRRAEALVYAQEATYLYPGPRQDHLE